MIHKMFLFVAALVLLFVQSAFAQTEELPDTVWTKFTYPNAVNAVKFTPDGRYLVSGGSDSIPRLWDAETGQLIREFPKQKSEILDIEVSSTFIAVACPGIGGLNIYDLKDFSLIKTLDGGLVIALSSNANYLVTSRGESGAGLTVIDTQSWEIIHQFGFTKSSYDLCISPDNKYLARSENYGDVSTENKEGSIEIYSFPDLKLLKILEKKEYLACMSLAFSPDGLYLAGAFDSTPDKIWNTSDWSLYKELGSAADSKSITYSPDSKYVLVGTGGFFNWRLNIYDTEKIKNTKSYKLDWLLKEHLGIDRGDAANSIDINIDLKTIAVGTSIGIYMLNAKWYPTSVKDNPVQIIEPLVFPNPTNSTANIRFDLLNSASINIQIYDINSRLIAHIFDGFLESGNHNFEWNTAQTPSGSYFARITTNGIVSSIQIIVNK